MGYHIGFVSTRFCGTDGVTLEASKWAQVFEQSGHSCFWFAGKLDRNSQVSLLAPEAHFLDRQNQWINERVFGKTGRSPYVTEFIHGTRSFLKGQLHRFIEKFKIDLLIAENVLTIPLHIPLGLALAEVMAETEIPTIAHHHDFYWERIRFSVNAVYDYLQMAFPPRLPNMRHVVLNSEAQEQLALRTGIASTIIPNVLDFENAPEINDRRAQRFREAIGLKPDDKIILQPTRIVQRKGIEHAIELVKALKNPRYKIIITHEAGDEGYEYVEWLKNYAVDQGVDLHMVETKISAPWSTNDDGEKKYSLWDVYAFADFITYPSLYEGFGNAFLEAVYLKKPILINRYSTFVKDIEPLGFKLPVMDGFLSARTVQKIKSLLESSSARQEMVDHNFSIASRHFSFHILRNKLDLVMRDLLGHEDTCLGCTLKRYRNIIFFKTEKNLLRGGAHKSVRSPLANAMGVDAV
jgi:glycosyltransferase involved in cell wall biosynthesis